MGGSLPRIHRGPMRVPLKAVIFDVDGVLLQSMDRNAEAYQAALAPLGIRIMPEEVFVNEGRRSRELLDLLARDHGRPLSDAELDEATCRHRESLTAFGPMPRYPGVDALLRELHGRGLRLAMVTGNWRANAMAPFADLATLFQVTVSAEDVTRTKPDPEAYLRALRELRVSPEEAVVVENAPLGIQAAKAAGLRVIAVTTTNPAESLRAADVVVPQVEDVLRALDALPTR